MRDYGTAQWEGGDDGCDHKKDIKSSTEHIKREGYKDAFRNSSDRSNHAEEPHYRDTCRKCGARRIDRQIGLEPTPEQYVETMVQVFREVRRVLRSDGTLWLNLGDSYTGGGGYCPTAPSNKTSRAGELGEKVPDLIAVGFSQGICGFEHEFNGKLKRAACQASNDELA